MDFYIAFTSGTHAGTRRPIIAFDTITGIVTFGGTPTFSVAVGDKFFIRGNKISEGARIDPDGDEGDEHFNATSGEWFGIDEALRLDVDGTVYWDDEFKEDLDGLQCGSLTVVIQACRTENETDSCFCGGFIDDLSALNRIIVTASNETSASYGDMDCDGFSEFSEVFIDALCGWNTTFLGSSIKPENQVNADFDGNGHVSMEEAFQYAYEHDDGRLAVRTANGRPDWYHSQNPTNPPPDESPWFDDDGDGLPTYINGVDNLDTNQGSIAKTTYLGWMVGDFDEDGDIDYDDQVIFISYYIDYWS